MTQISDTCTLLARLFGRWKWIVAMIFAQVLMLVQGATYRSPNVDEIGHLPAGVSHWLFSKFDLYRVSPPLVQVVSGLPPSAQAIDFDWILYSDQPGLRPEFTIGFRHLKRTKLESHKDFVAARLCCIVFPFLFTILLTVWVRSLMGIVPAHLACGFVCFCPNVLGNGQTIIPDVGSIAIGVLACSACWLYVQGPSRSSSLYAGFCLGLAMLTKLTWITALATLPMTILLCVMTHKRYFVSRSISARFIDLLLIPLVALLVLNAGYLFEGSFRSLGDYEFCSDTLGGEGCTGSIHGNRFKNTWLTKVPVPVPRNYLLGIDYLKMEVEERSWSFLMGEWKFGSWPHYYIMTTLFKTPEPTMLGALIGLGVLVVGIRRKMVEPKVISMFLFLAIPAAVCFASVSLQGGFNHHHRYVLQIYPPMFALAAYIASPVGQKLLRVRLPFGKRRLWSFAVPLAVTLAVLSAASSLRVHPYYTSYFNTLSGGPENGWRLLGFSNIDWGQDLLVVDKWIKDHPECQPLVFELDYFGMNGDLFGLPNASPPSFPKGASIDEVRASITETQWWIISVKTLYNMPNQPGLEYLQQLEPIDKIAYAYHVYRIDPLPSQ